MSGGIEGERPRGALTSQTNQQEAKPSQESQERQPLSSVWSVLERNVRLNATDVKDRPRSGSQEFWGELREVNRLRGELRGKGTPRDNVILSLFQWISTTSPYIWPGHRTVSLEEFQQFRSKVEPMSEEQIHEEIDKVKDEWSRKYDPFYEFHKRGEGL
jgi:hypothetical protein